jgi:DNA polymerase I-like protein with 3'-5' exonuclease and polymerase domains
MRTFPYTLDGRPTVTLVPESDRDLDRFWSFMDRAARTRLGVDSETSGLDIYARNHRLRTVQFGSLAMGEAWVLPVESGPQYADAARRVLANHPAFTAHNMPYDSQVVDRHLGIKLEDLMPRVRDTRIHAHLLDPRAKSEGGLGLRLKDLAAVYVDNSAPDTEDGLLAVFHSMGLVKANGFAGVAITDETYLAYAGLDTLLVSGLDERLWEAISGIPGQRALSEFEHLVAMILAIMQRKGMRLDVDYARNLTNELQVEGDRWRSAASGLGLDSVGSPAKVSAKLLEMGERLTEKTDSGAFKVDRAVLLSLSDLDMQWKRIGAREPNPVAVSVLRAKRADKWRVTYAEAMLNLRDPSDRIHPSLGGLMARTARMSVSNPPLQQLPSSDWTIRRCFISDPGHTMGGIDFQAVEMRVLAALADVKAMKRAILAGDDLHAFTAAMVEGCTVAEFTARLDAGDPAAAKSRKLLKGVGFGKVYGGGATTLARQTGAPMDAVKRAIEAYDRVYPEVKRYSRAIQREAGYGKREVITPTGRHLPMDRDRSYAGLNYMIQSTARDLLAQALVNVWAEGLIDYVLLPVHDELILQAPDAEISDVMAAVGECMATNFKGVPIAVDGEVFGRTWAGGYSMPPQFAPAPDLFTLAA